MASPPLITVQPENTFVIEGVGSATFVSEATGDPAPTAQWYRDVRGNGQYQLVAGATSGTLEVLGSSVTETVDDGDQYVCRWDNGQAPFAITSPVVLRVIEVGKQTVSVLNPKDDYTSAFAGAYPPVADGDIAIVSETTLEGNVLDFRQDGTFNIIDAGQTNQEFVLRVQDNSDNGTLSNAVAIRVNNP